MYCIIFYLSRIWVKHFKLASTLLFTLLSSTILLVYILNFISNLHWNDNVSLQFILAFLVDLPVQLEEIPFGLTSVIILVALIYIGTFWIYYRFANYLHQYDKSNVLVQSRVYLFITSITLALSYLSFEPLNPGIWDGEPISSLAIRSNTISHLTSSEEIYPFDKEENPVNFELQNIILVHADGVRADHMSSYGYPRDTTPYLRSLADEDTVQIKTGLSICSESICGILSALTSKHINTVDTETPLIQTYLKRAGYRTIITGSGKLSWENVDTIISNDIDYFVRADQDENFNMNDDNVILSALSKMPEYDGTPTYFYLHFMSSHAAGRHFSKYQKFTPAVKNILTYIFPAFDDPEITVNAYDNYVVQLDDMLRKSVDILTEKGYMKNSILIVYGDHGEALNEHGYYGHYHQLYQEEIHVPIIFSGAKSQLIKETEFATLNDILPTTLDMLNLDIPTDIEGKSLLEKHDKRITYHDNRLGSYAAIERSKHNDQNTMYKLIYNSKSKKIRLYNLTTDPSEKQDLLLTEPEKVETLLEQLKNNFKLDS